MGGGIWARKVQGAMLARMTTETGTADPIAIAMSGDDHSVCPECDHERQPVGFSLVTWAAVRLGMRASKPRCRYRYSSVESEGEGLPGACGCPHPFHSS